MYTLKLTPEEAGVLRAMLNHYDRLMATLPTPSFDCTAEDRHSMRRKLRDMEPDEEPAWRISLEFKEPSDEVRAANDDLPIEVTDAVLVDLYAVRADGKERMLAHNALMTLEEARGLDTALCDAGIHV